MWVHLFVCLFVRTELVFFSATACRIETKFSPSEELLIQNVFMIIMSRGVAAILDLP